MDTIVSPAELELDTQVITPIGNGTVQGHISYYEIPFWILVLPYEHNFLYMVYKNRLVSRSRVPVLYAYRLEDVKAAEQ